MKLLVGLFLVLGLCTKVDAKVYYSEYSEFSDYSLEKVESSELIDVEIERRNKWYRYVAKGGYYKWGENPIFEPYVNVNLYKFTDFSEWSKDYPGDDYGRLVERKEVCDNEECTIKHDEYRYKERYYYHYWDEKQYKEGYHNFVEGYIREEKDYKDFYRCRTRDKLDIVDNIVITNKDQKIEDFITSNIDYKIIGEIDYAKNGIYYIEIENYFIKVPITVTILLEDNIKSYYNNLLSLKEEKIVEIEKNNKITEGELLELKLEKQELIDNHLIEKQDWVQKLNLKQEMIDSYMQKYAQELKKTESLQQDISDITEQNNEIKIKKETLDNQLNSKNDLLIFAQLDKNSLQEELNNELEEKNQCLQKYDDIIKKYTLCQQNHDSLEQKLDGERIVQKQSLLSVCFIISILSMFICLLLRIKSMKKKG